MRISGVWRVCDDRITRRTFWGEIMDAREEWLDVTFLADCGADRTVFSIDVFNALAFPPIQGEQPLAGVGGTTDAVEFSSVLRMRRSDGQPVIFRARFAALAGSSTLDMSVLGRDITNLLALVIDRPSNTVCLLSRGEIYRT
jgi:hypothetical protein